MDLGPWWFVLPWDPADLRSWYFILPWYPVDLGPWEFVLPWDLADLGSWYFILPWYPVDLGPLRIRFAMRSCRSWILRFQFAVGSCGSWILFFGHGTSLVCRLYLRRATRVPKKTHRTYSTQPEAGASHSQLLPRCKKRGNHSPDGRFALDFERVCSAAGR